MLLSSYVVILIVSLAKKTQGIDASTLNLSKEVSIVKNPGMQSTLRMQQNASYWTAGNSLCLPDTPCDFYGKAYKWCYTDIKKQKWDYCCTGACERRGKNYLWCPSGNTWQYCGSPGTKTIDKTNCLPTSPCGLHLDVDSKTDYYWCYVDMFQNYKRCCQPGFACEYNKESYKWCWTGYLIQSGKWNHCKQ